MLVRFEQNRMAESTRNFEFYDKKSCLKKKHFWQNVDAIFENVPAAETIVWC